MERNAMDAQIKPLVDSVIPKLVEEIVPLFLHAILKEDYQLKVFIFFINSYNQIARQGYFTSKLQEGIDKLNEHGVRIDSLLKAFQLEHSDLLQKLNYLKNLEAQFVSESILLYFDFDYVVSVVQKRLGHYFLWIRSCELNNSPPFVALASPGDDYISRIAHGLSLHSPVLSPSSLFDEFENESNASNGAGEKVLADSLALKNSFTALHERANALIVKQKDSLSTLFVD